MVEWRESRFPMPSLNFYLSLTAFLVSLCCGIYFAILWFRARKNFFLFWWALGFWILLWFKVPSILANAGVDIVQTDFNVFFYATFMLYLVSYGVFMQGLGYFTEHFRRMYVRAVFLAMVAGAAGYYALTFFVEGASTTYAPVWASNVLFYIPLQILILFLFHQSARDVPDHLRKGRKLLQWGVLATLASSIMYIVVQVSPYPRLFWYYSVVNAPFISFLQIVALGFFFFGFRALAQTRALLKQ